MRRARAPTWPIMRVRYEAPVGHDVGLEIFDVAEFRRRVTTAHLRRPQRVDFHAILYFTRGRCTHTVDFESLACRRGTLLLVSPGQVQQFDPRSDGWAGGMVLFRSELLPAQMAATDGPAATAILALTDFAVHRQLGRQDQTVVATSLARMAEDARDYARARALGSLLRHQLWALRLRLSLIETPGPAPPAARAQVQRFKRYRHAVDREFARLHRVADYARLIGCSQKSLQRASISVTGVGAKSYLSERIALEAKRLLVHTEQPVSVVAEALGFDEVTNFVKFFRRLTGSAPGEFRRRHVPR